MNRKIIFALLVLLLMCVSVFATPLNVEMDLTHNIMNVSGDLGQANANHYVVLQVINPDKTVSDLLNGAQGVLNWQDVSTTNSTGAYMFSFVMNGETGDYTIRVGCDSVNDIYTKTFKYYNPNEATLIWDRVRNAVVNNNATEFQWIVENRAEMLQLDMTYFDTLPDPRKVKLYANMAKATYTNLSSVAKVFLSLSRIQALNEKANVDVAQYTTILNSIASQSALVAKSIFDDDLNVVGESAVIADMMNGEYDSEAFLINNYNTVTVTYAVNHAGLWGDVVDILKKAQTQIGIDFTVYNSLSNPSIAINNMRSVPVETLDGIKTKFDEVVAAQKLAETTKVTDGGSSSSGNSNGYSNTKITLNPDIQLNPPLLQDVFVDLVNYEWAKESINVLYSKHVISTNEQNEFFPGNNITRAEFTKLVLLAFAKEVKSSELPFTDVSSNEWYFNYIATAYKDGIVNGASDNLFMPNSPITRQDICTILYRIKQDLIPKQNTTLQFVDVGQISSYAVDAVTAFSNAKIVSGFADNTFAPLSYGTRAEAVQLIYKLLQYSEGKI